MDDLKLKKIDDEYIKKLMDGPYEWGMVNLDDKHTLYGKGYKYLVKEEPT